MIVVLTLPVISFSTLHDDTLSHNFVKICNIQGKHTLKAHNEPAISSFDLNYIIYKDPVSTPPTIRSVNILNTGRLMLYKETINICRNNRWDYRKCADNTEMF